MAGTLGPTFFLWYDFIPTYHPAEKSHWVDAILILLSLFLKTMHISSTPIVSLPWPMGLLKVYQEDDSLFLPTSTEGWYLWLIHLCCLVMRETNTLWTSLPILLVARLGQGVFSSCTVCAQFIPIQTGTIKSSTATAYPSQRIGRLSYQ